MAGRFAALSGLSGVSSLRISLVCEDAEDAPAQCHFCAETFCSNHADVDICRRGLTYVTCCSHALCCACLARQAEKCPCEDDCEQVVCVCPFCRKISRVGALDLFRSGKPACKACTACEPSKAAEAD